MKIKQIIIVTLMLVAILAISAVSAADDIAINETQDPIVSSMDTDIIANGDDENNYNEIEELEYEIYVDPEYYLEDYNSELIYYGFYNKDADGNLTLYMDNVELKTYSLNESSYRIISANDLGLKNLTFKEYTINAVYTGDSKYDDFNETFKFNGSWKFWASFGPGYDLDYEINYIYGQEIGFYITTSNARGTVECYVNGKKYKSMTTEELARVQHEETFHVNFLIEGDAFKPNLNHVEFKYVGNDYPETTREFDVDLMPAIKYSSNRVPFNENLNFILKLPEDAEGDLNIYIVNVTNGDYWEGIPGKITSYQLIGSSPVINGVGNVTIPCPAIGEYYIYANYTGSDYNASLGQFDDEDGYYYPLFTIMPKVEIPSKIYPQNKYNISITLPESYNGIFSATINGETKNINVSDGKASIELFNYETIEEDYLYVYFDYEDDDYSFSSSQDVEISYINPEFELKITAENTLIGQNDYSYSYKNLPSAIEGDVNIFIDGAFITSGDIKDTCPINLSNMNMGEHTLKVDYLGDGYYLPTSASVKFNISDVVIIIDEDVTIGTYDENYSESYYAEIITIYDTGYYTIRIDGELLDTEVMDNSAIIPLNNFTYGKHEVEITYKNSEVEKSKKQTVDAHYTIMNYNIPEDYGDYYKSRTFSFTLPNEVKGNLIVSVDKNYTVKIVDGKASFAIDHLDEGTYITKTRYDGDEYPEFTQTYEPFIVREYCGPYYDGIKGPQKSNLEYGENLTITVDYEPTIKAKLWVYGYFNGKRIEYGKVQIVNGKAEITISNLTYGYHEIEGTLADYEDMEYFDNQLEGEYYVRPLIDESVDCISRTITFGDTLTFDIEFASDANDTVYAYIDGKDPKLVGEFKLNNGKATAHINEYYLGSNKIYIKYDDDKYHFYDTAMELLVYPNITYPERMAVGSDEYLIMTMPDDAKGNLEVFGIEATLKNGSAKIPLSGLKIGSHLINITYTNDDTYGSFYYLPYEEWLISKNIDVTKPEADMLVTKTETTLNVMLNDDANGYVIIKVADAIYSEHLINGSVTITGLDLDSVENVTVSYSGDEKYMLLSKKSMKANPIIKQDANMTVKADNISIGEAAAISIELNENATGDILIQIEGKNITSIITNGKANITIYDLPAGTYNVTVIYSGDKYVLEEVKTQIFTVSKLPAPQIVIDTLDSEVEGSDLTVTVTIEKATGNITINSETISLNNSQATTTIKNLTEGNLTINVEYQGNNIYLSSKANKTVNIYAKKDSELNATAENIKVGEIAVIKITINSEIEGNLTVNNEKVEIANGTTTYEISGLGEGNYTIDIAFAGNKYYKPAQTTAKFTVNKLPAPEIIIDTVDSEVEGSDLTVTITIENATGNITINGETITLNNSQATTTIKNLTEGNLTINVEYLGNNIYLSSKTNKTVNIYAKKDSELNATTSNIKVGEIAVIKITINSEIEGKLTVNNEEVEIVDGMVIYGISGLGEGNHTIDIAFAGNKYFNAAETSVLIQVSKVQSPQENPFGSNETQVSTNPTYSISYPSDATGNLTVTIANKTYTAELVNGSASITVTDMPAGEYDVVINYSGDAKYAPVTKTTKATVKVDPRIVANDMTVLYYAGKYYSVTVYGDDGKPAAKTNVMFTLNGKKLASTKTDAKGIAKFKVTQTPVTKGKLVTTALGVSVTKKLTVKRVIVLKKATVKRSAKKLVLQATLKKVNGKYLKNKKITFKFNGKRYTAKTSTKGIAKVTINKSVLLKLKAGKKITYTATYVKDTVKKTVQVKK